MKLETEDTFIRNCLSRIESELGWGEAQEWSTQDFETLSRRIMEKTHVQLSIITLKRMWGRIRYESKPTITTLNTLAQFIGFENWRAFKQHAPSPIRADVGANAAKEESSKTKSDLRIKRRKPVAIFAILGLVCAAITILLYITSFDTPRPALDPSKFTFSSKKMVEEGVPNSVIFDYNASAAKATDSVFVQQSWDKRLSRQVDRDQFQHTSIYYHPGFFQAKLRINDEVVQEHDLLIKTKGWLPLVDLKPVPVYFKEADILNDGFIGLSLNKIIQNNISLQPGTPWVGYYNVGDFGDIKSDDVIFETEIRNEYSDGAAACQHAEVHVLFEGATMVIPLSVPGCVSELNLGDLSGKKLDLSPLGVDFSKWVKVKFTVRDSLVQVFINDKKAFDLKAQMTPVRLSGMIYRFQGTGSVNSIRISRHNGDVTYEEDFDLKQ